MARIRPSIMSEGATMSAPALARNDATCSMILHPIIFDAIMLDAIILDALILDAINNI